MEWSEDASSWNSATGARAETFPSFVVCLLHMVLTYETVNLTSTGNANGSK